MMIPIIVAGYLFGYVTYTHASGADYEANTFTLKPDVSLYKQFTKYGVSQDFCEKMKKREQEYVEFLYKYNSGLGLAALGDRGYFEKILCYVTMHEVEKKRINSGEITGKVSEIKKVEAQNFVASRKNASFGDFAKVCMAYQLYFGKKSFKNDAIDEGTRKEVMGDLKKFENILDFHCIHTINEEYKICSGPIREGETSAMRHVADDMSLRFLCAKKHLEFFRIAPPTDSKQAKTAYSYAKKYKQWYATSWLPKIFWFWYKKPDLKKFNELKMQYRYAKYMPQG